MGFEPTDDQKREVFRNSMLYEIVYAFGVPTFDETDYCLWEMVNFTRMGHARVLYDFFETTKAKRRLDDVIAEDFGYEASRIDLPDGDRLRLNKDLFHFSYKRLRHTPETKPWPDSILGCLLEPVLGFMRYIRDRRPDLFGPDPSEKTVWEGVIAILESGRELLISDWTEHDGKRMQSFSAGRHLPGGKPLLTTHFRRSTPA